MVNQLINSNWRVCASNGAEWKFVYGASSWSWRCRWWCTAHTHTHTQQPWWCPVRCMVSHTHNSLHSQARAIEKFCSDICVCVGHELLYSVQQQNICENWTRVPETSWETIQTSKHTYVRNVYNNPMVERYGRGGPGWVRALHYWRSVRVCIAHRIHPVITSMHASIHPWSIWSSPSSWCGACSGHLQMPQGSTIYINHCSQSQLDQLVHRQLLNSPPPLPPGASSFNALVQTKSFILPRIWPLDEPKGFAFCQFRRGREKKSVFVRALLLIRNPTRKCSKRKAS